MAEFFNGLLDAADQYALWRSKQPFLGKLATDGPMELFCFGLGFYAFGLVWENNDGVNVGFMCCNLAVILFTLGTVLPELIEKVMDHQGGCGYWLRSTR